MTNDQRKAKKEEVIRLSRDLAAQRWKTIPQEVLDGLPVGAILIKDQEGYWRYLHMEASTDEAEHLFND